VENVKAAAHLLGDRLLKRSTVSTESIARGEAGVVARGREQVAVARKADGSTTELSAVCTHMGCIVGWNEIDRTWDCPCHGSRFDDSGDLLSGPAVSPAGTRPESQYPRSVSR
jgi:Rieske Fe-S protein